MMPIMLRRAWRGGTHHLGTVLAVILVTSIAAPLVGVGLIALLDTAPNGNDLSSQFARLSSVEQRAAIVRFPPQTQVDLYVAEMSYHRPPNSGLADELAAQGAEIVPHVLARLAITDYDPLKYYLVNVLDAMTLRGYYNVGSDRQVVAELEQRIRAMESGIWKDMATETLARINTPSKR